MSLPTGVVDPTDSHFPITWDVLRTAVMMAPTSAPRGRRFAEASVPQILSDTKRGLIAVMIQREGITAVEARDRISDTDLRPLLPLAPEAGRRAVLMARGSAPSARAAARNAAARCRQAMRAVDVNLLSRGYRGRDHGAAAPPAWRTLLDLYPTDGTRPRERRELQRYKAQQVVRACLLRVAQFLAARGIDTPSSLPTDPDALALQLRDAGTPPHVVGNLLYAVRKSRRDAEQRGIDVSHIPLWPAKRKGDGYSRFADDWRGDPPAGLARDLPVFSRWLDVWLKATHGTVSAATQDTVAQAVRRVGYALKQMAESGRLPGYDLMKITPFDLCEAQVPGERIGSATVEHIEQNEIAESMGLQRLPGGVPLLHALTQFQLHQAPIRRRVQSAKMIVPPGVRNDISLVWLLVRAVARAHTFKQHPERWSIADLQFREWLAATVQMHEAAGRPTARNIGKLLDHVTLPQLVVIGLPWLTLIQLPSLVEVLMTARSRVDRIAAMKAYRQTLFRWAALAVPASAPLRLNQFQFGRIGTRADREFELHASFRPDGSLDHVLRVTTHFGGRLHHFPDNLQAAIKQRGALMAAWVCRPSILDLARLGDYLREVWWTRALERGLDRGRTMQKALADGDLALFLSDRNGSKINPVGGYGGNGADLADACGEALLCVMRDAFGRDVPPTKPAAAAAGWGYLLTEHPLRHLYATYWYGLRATHAVIRRVDEDTQVVRTGAQIASEATRDVEKTLARTYSRVTETMTAHLDRSSSSWAHPFFFNKLMDGADDPNHVVDWAAVWETLLAQCGRGADALPKAVRSAWEAKRGHGGAVARPRRPRHNGARRLA